MSDLTFEKYCGEFLQISKKAFKALPPEAKVPLVAGWRDEIRKEQTHEAQLQRYQQANGETAPAINTPPKLSYETLCALLEEAKGVEALTPEARVQALSQQSQQANGENLFISGSILCC
mmetsp:Transcript_25491/g.37659  ORF Transcript_25491/g.37659 Transcript_25491/m.37659 type:complete len:119 (-) Transcript_25491:493-849(-)